MKLTEALAKIPRESATYFALCLSGVLILVFAGIVPAWRDGLRVEEKIQEARRLIDEDENLRPLFHSLQAVPAGGHAGLMLPPKTDLPRTQIRKADAAIRAGATGARMKVVSLVPDLAAFAGDSRTLAMNVSLSGDLADFRSLLIRLGALPYVEQVEEFAIQRGKSARQLDITMKVLIAVE